MSGEDKPFNKYDTPKREEPTGEYRYHFRPAKHLPDGWGWQEWNDGSGSLVSPDGKSVVSYDLQTKEYKIDGEWNFMGDGKFEREHFERLVRAEYLQTEKSLEKEPDFMSKYDISARVNPLSDQSGKVKAMASVTIDNAIAINNLTVV